MLNAALSLNPCRITPIHWLMVRRHLWRNDVVSSYWRARHPLLRFVCLHEAVTLPFVVAISGPNLSLRSSICTSVTASVELCSPRGEVPWSFAAVNWLHQPRGFGGAGLYRHAVCAIHRSLWPAQISKIICLGFTHAVFGIWMKFCENLRLITLRFRLEVCEKESSIFFSRHAPEASTAWGSDV